MKKKIIGNLVDIILFGIVFRVTDAVLLKVFQVITLRTKKRQTRTCMTA